MTIKDQNGQVILKSKVNNSITYTGRRYDSESGLYYYRNRMYSAQLGRFIQQDPKGYVDGMNLYAYVKNNPLKYLDAMGTTAYINNFSGTVFDNWQADYNSNINTSELDKLNMKFLKIPGADYNQDLPSVGDMISTPIGIIASTAENIGKEFDNLSPSSKHILGVGGKVVGNLKNAIDIITSQNLYEFGKNVTKTVGGIAGGIVGTAAGGLIGVGIATVAPPTAPIVVPGAIVVGAVAGSHLGGEFAGDIYDKIFK